MINKAICFLRFQIIWFDFYLGWYGDKRETARLLSITILEMIFSQVYRHNAMGEAIQIPMDESKEAYLNIINIQIIRLVFSVGVSLDRFFLK